MSTYGERLSDAESRVRYGFDGARVAKGQTDHPSQRAQLALSALATEWIRADGGMPKKTRGKYGLRDKYADTPSFSLSPYRTPTMYASGKAGRRAVPPR